MGRRKNVASQLHHMIPSSKDEGLGGDFITDVEVEVTFFPAVKGGVLDGWKFCEGLKNRTFLVFFTKNGGGNRGAKKGV